MEGFPPIADSGGCTLLSTKKKVENQRDCYLLMLCSGYTPSGMFYSTSARGPQGN